MINVYNILFGKYERTKPLGGLGCRREGNIRTDVTGTECERVDWIQLAEDRVQWRAVVNTVMNLGNP
jgi:hypothetical protein